MAETAIGRSQPKMAKNMINLGEVNVVVTEAVALEVAEEASVMTVTAELA